MVVGPTPEAVLGTVHKHFNEGLVDRRISQLVSSSGSPLSCCCVQVQSGVSQGRLGRPTPALALAMCALELSLQRGCIHSAARLTRVPLIHTANCDPHVYVLLLFLSWFFVCCLSLSLRIESPVQATFTSNSFLHFGSMSLSVGDLCWTTL